MQTILGLGDDIAVVGMTRADKVVRALRHFMHRKSPQNGQPVNANSAGDLAQQPKNDTATIDGTYDQEDLTDPQIVDPITGSGGGPLIRT